MLNSQRVERRSCRRRAGSFKCTPTAAKPSRRPPRSPSSASRCAHLDKLNYKLDGSLVATRGNVVGAWICMIYTRNPTHRYNSCPRALADRGDETALSLCLSFARSHDLIFVRYFAVRHGDWWKATLAARLGTFPGCFQPIYTEWSVFADTAWMGTF